MCSQQYVSQPSCDLGIYLPEVDDEDISFYQSPDRLIDSFNINLPSSAHRMGAELFDLINNDLDASSTLSYDQLSLTDDNNCDIDDITFYCWKQSSVVPHTPNLANESKQKINSPLSSPHSNVSSPSSSLPLNQDEIRKFYVFDIATGRYRRPFLYEFIQYLLENAEYSHIAEYMDRKQGIFKLHKPVEVAELWENVKGRNSDNKMTYDKLARSLRYYYRRGIMHSNPGRFTFRFGSKSGYFPAQ